MTDRYRHLLAGHEPEAARLLDQYLARADTAARVVQLEDHRAMNEEDGIAAVAPMIAAATGLTIEEVRAKLAAGERISLTGEQSTALFRAQADARGDRFWQSADDGDYSQALHCLGSTEVAHGILALDREFRLTRDETRDLLAEHFSRCDSPGDSTEGLLALFHRAEYVSDQENPRPEGCLRIYRGTLGDDPREGISWTLSEEQARWFAEHGARGSGRDRSIPTVWAATVEAENVLGYFTGRGEEEVIIDPADVSDVTAVS